MHEITCTVRDFNATADTCTVEIQGIGIVDAWLDGVGIAPSVDRSYIVEGAEGVVSLADINRMCDATLIQVTPPGGPSTYDPDPIIVYTGSLLIPTDATGAGCTTVVFPTPYLTVPTINASAARPATLSITNITEAGFTACVTGGRVSSKHAVSYTARSKTVVTASKNKAPTVDHNETDVATHYIIDFKDGDVVWTVTDRASPARAQIEATLSADYAATLGGGAADPAPGAATYGCSTAVHFPFNSPVDMPWDHIIAGDDKYLNAANPNALTIPTNGDGDYLVVFAIWYQPDSWDASTYGSEYHASIEHDRGTSQLAYYEQIDLYTQDTNTDSAGTGEQSWPYVKVFLAAPICGAKAGDVIKTDLSVANNTAAVHASTTAGDDAHTYVGLFPRMKNKVALPVASRCRLWGSSSIWGASEGNPNWLGDLNADRGSNTTDASSVAIHFDTVVIDTDSFFHSPDSVVFPAAGTYLCQFTAQWVLGTPFTSPGGGYDLEFWLSSDTVAGETWPNGWVDHDRQRTTFPASSTGLYAGTVHLSAWVDAPKAGTLQVFANLTAGATLQIQNQQLSITRIGSL